MQILYYDCFAGISGDMHLGAMIDAGVDPDHLIRELEKLPVAGFSLKIGRGIRRGIEGTRVKVLLDHENTHSHDHSHDHDQPHDHSHGHNDPHSHDQPIDHSHDHPHSHDHDQPIDHSHSHGHNQPHSHDHSHGHDHSHTHDHDHTDPSAGKKSVDSHHHVHRNLHDIEQIVSGSSLDDRVKQRAMKMFLLIAKAESKIHGVPIDKIHFHEVGALDSIVDVVGAAICIEYLNPDRIISSTVELGGGMIRCAHGTMPVPAPATAEILKDIPVKLGTTPHEATTPTGAAIIAANADQFSDQIRFTPTRTAYGIGGRDMDIPNVLRIHLGEIDDVESQNSGSVIIECNIDDMNPELYGHVMDQLFSKGADDVYITPIIMKKSRPAAMLSVLCDKSLENTMTETILLQTTSLGLRSYSVSKQMLRRDTEKISTSLGEANVKKAWYKGRLLKSKVEYEDCRRMAEEHNLSIQDVYRIIASETGNMDKFDKINKTGESL